MKILVCGSEGRIMSYVIPKLIAQGHSVIGIDNGQKWGKKLKQRQYELVWGDCTDAQLLSSTMYKVDAVIQAAATLYGVIGFHKYPADILGNDLIVQKTVLSAAIKTRIKRFVYISSSMVYDRSNHCSEEGQDLALPITDYGLSKLVSERLIYAFNAQHGLDFTIWRPFNAFDPEEKESNEIGISHVVPDFIHRIVEERQNPMTILGDGQQVRCFCHINEIADVIADYSFGSTTKNKVFNVGRREPISMKELAQAIYDQAAQMNLVEHNSQLSFISLQVPKTDVRERIGDFTKLKEDLGWESAISLKTMIHEALVQYVDRKINDISSLTN